MAERTTLRALGALAALVLSSSAVLANSPPVVSNVSASQGSDKLVSIHYDLSDLDGDACTISVQASDDAGATWALPITAVTGELGPGVAPGKGRLIVWDSKLDLPGIVGSAFKVRVCADDGNNLPPQISAPAIGGLLMEGGPGTAQFSCRATDEEGPLQSVVVDLSAIGGPSSQALAKGSSSQWLGSTTVTPPTRGQWSVTFTAIDARGLTASTQAMVKVAPPEMVLIPAGEFTMGDSFIAEGDTDERPLHSVRVNAFFMDQHEVTNQEYAAALNWALAQGGLITVSGGIVYQPDRGVSRPYCDTQAGNEYSRITWNGSQFGIVSGAEHHPVVLVSWYGAVAYANWRSGMQGLTPSYDSATWNRNSESGYRLPTEAEWERAARGGMPGRRFPWLDTDNIDHSRANYYSSSGKFYDAGLPYGYDPEFSVGTIMPYTSPVGSFPITGYGLFDMAGNAWEWCEDWFDGEYYSNSPQLDPRGPAAGATRVLRGGSWSSLAVCQRCAYRNDALPGYRAMVSGFRLVLAVE